MRFPEGDFRARKPNSVPSVGPIFVLSFTGSNRRERRGKFSAARRHGHYLTPGAFGRGPAHWKDKLGKNRAMADLGR